MRDVIADHGDCAMVNPGRNRLETGGLCQLNHPVRQRIGRNVDIRDRRAQKGIAHAAPDKQGLRPAFGQGRANPLSCWV